MLVGDIVFIKREYLLFSVNDEFEIKSLHEGGIVGVVWDSENSYLVGKEFYVPYEVLEYKEGEKMEFEEKYPRQTEYPEYYFNLEFEEDILDIVVQNASTVKERLIDYALLNKDKKLFEYAISGKLDWEEYNYG